ncbi:MAG: hypothetical protein ACREFU_00235 [Acetobacteraceae bacterium]
MLSGLRSAANQFFVMAQKAVNAGVAAEFARLSPQKQALGE